MGYFFSLHVSIFQKLTQRNDRESFGSKSIEKEINSDKQMLPSLNFVQYAFFEGGNGFQLTQSFVTNRLSTLARR